MDNINAAISFIEAAKDENQALRRVVRRVAEVRQFYVSKQHYRLDDEFLFEDKVNEFKLAEPGRKPQLAKEMEQLVLNFCFSKDSDLLKKSSETSDLY